MQTVGAKAKDKHSAPHSRGAFRKTKLCTFFRESRCDKGADCKFAHGEAEVLDLTKTSMCLAWLEGHCLDDVSSCRYAHGESDLRPVTNASAPPAREVFQKTKLCVFFKNNQCHMGAHCRFAHGEGDLRTNEWGMEAIALESSQPHLQNEATLGLGPPRGPGPPAEVVPLPLLVTKRMFTPPSSQGLSMISLPAKAMSYFSEASESDTDTRASSSDGNATPMPTLVPFHNPIEEYRSPLFLKWGVGVDTLSEGILEARYCL